jgi:sugar lactone lactonase YvrE
VAEFLPPTVRLLSAAAAAIGESPAWHNERVQWTDPVAKRLLRVGSDGRLESIAMASPVWSQTATPEGVIVGALEDRFCAVSAAGEISAGPAATIDAGCRFNDMAVDPHGGLWVGMMHRGILATRGAIFHARSLRDQPTRVALGLGVPNGMKLSADGSTLFVIDTLERTLLAYPVNSGTLGQPVIVGDFLDMPGKPDGMAIAPDGTFWVAMWGGGCVVQLARDGAPLRRIALPAPHVSSLCFAAANRVLVTTSRMRMSPQALQEYPSSGGLFEILLEPA